MGKATATHETGELMFSCQKSRFLPLKGWILAFYEDQYASKWRTQTATQALERATQSAIGQMCCDSIIYCFQELLEKEGSRKRPYKTLQKFRDPH